tara:strand:- start:15580 stop:16464 length:885 start_codon:yes stop_codon:yes gene_type:complete
MMALIPNQKIGIVIPCHNNLDVLKESLPSIYDDNCLVTIFDDGSSDGTKEWVINNYPKVNLLEGDGNNWWTGSLAKAIDNCIREGCDYIVSLNADVIASGRTILKLIESSKKLNNCIVASLVVDIKDSEKILWSGSVFKKIHKFIPIYASKYIYKSGTNLSSIPKDLYEVDEVHGRCVLFPSEVIDKIGDLDYKNFPQYGGDTDYSFRAKKAGIKMFIDPQCISKVFTQNTNLKRDRELSIPKRFFLIFDYLFKRKNGEALFVWWKLYRKHLPLRYFLQSYIFVIILNIYRRLY